LVIYRDQSIAQHGQLKPIGSFDADFCVLLPDTIRGETKMVCGGPTNAKRKLPDKTLIARRSLVVDVQ